MGTVGELKNTVVRLRRPPKGREDITLGRIAAVVRIFCVHAGDCTNWPGRVVVGGKNNKIYNDNNNNNNNCV